MAVCYSHKNKKSIRRLRWGKDSAYHLAWVSEDRTVTIADFSNGDEAPTMQPKLTVFKGHEDTITDVDWSLTDDFLISCSLDSTVRVWDKKKKNPIHVLQHENPVLCCAFHPKNNNTVVVGTQNGDLTFYNVSLGKELQSFKINSEIRCVTFSSNGMLLVVGCSRGKIYWFKSRSREFNSFKPKGKFQVGSVGRAIGSISYKSFVGHHALLINTGDSTVRLYKFFPNARVGQNCGDCLKLWMICPIVNKDELVALHSSFSPLFDREEGSASFVTGSEDGMVYCFSFPVKGDSDAVLDFSFNESFHLSDCHKGSILDVAWNSNQSFLASCDSSGQLLLWKAS